MKTKFVLASLVATLTVLEVSAQRAEYDDMYFRGKDREKNNAIAAEENIPVVKNKKQKSQEAIEEENNSNPTDSYSARNVNPEYVSRENSEQASEDETNYYVEGYAPASNNQFSYNNSYYNNSNWARNSYYANSGWNSPYYGGCGYCNSGVGMYSPFNYGYYDPFMMPVYGYGYPSYGWRSGWSVSFTYGNYWSPWGYGGYNPYNNFYNPYYGYGYSNYYYGGNNYNYEGSRPNYAKRPSRHSAVVSPTTRTENRTRGTVTGNSSTNNNSGTVTSGRTRARQPQDDYYVRPARRTSLFDNSSASPSYTRPSNNDNSRDFFSTPSHREPSRSRDFSSPSPSHNSSPSYSPPSSPSRSSGGSSGGGGGGSSPRPRGRN